jgi:hypothetical protein
MAGFVMPWMFSRITFLWRFAPPLPKPLPPLPLPDMFYVWRAFRDQSKRSENISAAKLWLERIEGYRFFEHQNQLV